MNEERKSEENTGPHFIFRFHYNLDYLLLDHDQFSTISSFYIFKKKNTFRPLYNFMFL